MQLILDNLSAIIIGTMLTVSLLSAQVRVSQAGAEELSAYSAKTKALSLGKWMEQDILSLGDNLGQDPYRFELPTYNALGDTEEWVFWSDEENASSVEERHFTRYKLLAVDQIALSAHDGADSLDASGNVVMRPLYKAERYVAKKPTPFLAENLVASDWTRDGFTVSTLARFRIELLLTDGSVVDPTEAGAEAKRDAADYIRLQFTLVPEFERERNYLRELFWATTLKVRPFWEQPLGTTTVGSTTGA